MKKPSSGQTIIQIFLSLDPCSFYYFLCRCLYLKFRPLYYLDMGLLNISQTSGYSEEEIRANYDVLIDYNSIFGPDTLEFPTLPMSETGEIHFEEVKVIFVNVQILCIVTFILGLAGILWQRRKKDWRYLKYASILAHRHPCSVRSNHRP